MARLGFLALVVLVAAHDLVYGVGHGFDRLADELSASGHDPYWHWIGLAALATLAALGLTAARRGRALSRRLARLGGTLQGATLPGAGIRRIVVARPTPGAVAGLWLRLLAIALPAFVLQENLEHYLAHAGHLPLLGVLAEPNHLAALPAFGLVGLVVAGLASAVHVRLASLQRAVEIAERWSLRPSATHRPGPAAPPPVRRPRTNTLATPDLGRAPPLASLA